MLDMDIRRDGISAPLLDELISDAEMHPRVINSRKKKLMLAIFDELQAIEISGDDERRELSLCVPRGRAEDFGDYEEYLDCGKVQNYREFENYWRRHYPNPVSWYSLVALHCRDTYSIFLNEKLILHIAPRSLKKHASEDTELANWLLSAVSEAISGEAM
jgi:hypothetical protein